MEDDKQKQSTHRLAIASGIAIFSIGIAGLGIISNAQETTLSPRATYSAQFFNANGSATSGTAKLVVDGDRLGVFVQAFGLDPNIPHAAHIHAGSQCPTFSADTNGDGFIDVMEAEAVSGKEIVNLDFSSTGIAQAGSVPSAVPLPSASPSSAATGAVAASATPSASSSPIFSQLLATYPKADNSGNLTFIQSYSLGAIQAALQNAASTASPSPSVSATASASPVASTSPTASASPQAAATAATSAVPKLDQFVIEIHGVDPNMQLPETVATEPGLNRNEALPVACAKIFNTLN